MNSTVEILLVDDNPCDIELTLRAFEKRNIANKVQVVRDGAEAMNNFGLYWLILNEMPSPLKMKGPPPCNP
ncbi:MAG: hypothetical protein V2A34_15395 [Lentisphaerota bacterium]